MFPPWLETGLFFGPGEISYHVSIREAVRADMTAYTEYSPGLPAFNFLFTLRENQLILVPDGIFPRNRPLPSENDPFRIEVPEVLHKLIHRIDWAIGIVTPVNKSFSANNISYERSRALS